VTVEQKNHADRGYLQSLGSRILRSIRLPSDSGATGPNLFCRWARFALVSLGPVLLDLAVQVLTLLLHFRAFFVPVNQIRTEQIEFVIQSDELTHQLVLHSAVHRFIVLSYPSRGIAEHWDRGCPTPRKPLGFPDRRLSKLFRLIDFDEGFLKISVDSLRLGNERRRLCNISSQTTGTQ
jgi:hypothetical protein